MRLCFVILHYLAEDITGSCIDTLLQKFGDINAQIVVVDNASANGSGNRLASKYSGRDNIHFILLSENLGFARGNNAGYRYACDNLNSDFIVVMNNDVLIQDRDFTAKIEEEYRKNPFAVLGPDIFSPNAKIHQNPSRLTVMNLAEAEDLKQRLDRKNIHFSFNYLKWQVKLLLGLAAKSTPPEHSPELPHSDCVLHGACYIFSKDFCSKRQYAFNPGTFLYMEEDILAYECIRDGLKIRYTPEIKVLHLEDVSTKVAFRWTIKREKMKNQRMSESAGVLISEMKK